jgi:predicted CXXCH cytochrome family protein
MKPGAVILMAAGLFTAAAAVAARAPVSPANGALVPLASPAPHADPPAGSKGPWWLEPGDARRFVGSDRCARCHEQAYADWQQYLHVQMTKPVGQASILGDFSPGTRLAQHGRRYTMERRGDRYFIAISHGGRPAETFEVHYTLGFKRVQGYLSRLPDGRIYVLPAFWHREARRWIDWREIAPVPDTDADLRQIWNVTCFNCHATNLSKSFDPATRTYETTWQEMGIGCEGCHGPGEAHVSLMEAWEADPSRKPAYSRRRTNRDLSRTLKIFAARTADRRQVFDTCAYCHGNKNNLFVGFTPGDRYDDYALPFLVSQPPVPDDPQGDFWPDGRPSRFNRPQALMQAGCFLRGGAACTSCHAAHGSPNPFSLKLPFDESDLLCLQCHGPADEAPIEASDSGPVRPPRRFASDDDISAHTQHAPASPGARCVACHMADVNWRLLMRRRDHTFKAPVPEITARYGVPNACTECHDDRTPEWASAAMDRLWGDRVRRARELEVAEAMYLAASGDAAAVPLLASLLVDRERSPIVRASAAEFLFRMLAGQGGAAPGAERTGESQTSFAVEGRLNRGESRIAAARGPGAVPPPDRPARPAGPADVPGDGPAAARSAPAGARPVPPRIVNALRGAAADPEPMVRYWAAQALGATGDPGIVPSLTARLVDGSRTVRVAAVEALTRLGVTALPGAAGQALARAQDEYAASLATFGETAGEHLALGWFELQRGRDAAARTALQQALQLDPDRPEARVFLGVIAARAGAYDEAIREWQRVRAAHPEYPNIERLIDEAKQRRGRPEGK